MVIGIFASSVCTHYSVYIAAYDHPHCPPRVIRTRSSLQFRVYSRWLQLLPSQNSDSFCPILQFTRQNLYPVFSSIGNRTALTGSRKNWTGLNTIICFPPSLRKLTRRTCAVPIQLGFNEISTSVDSLISPSSENTLYGPQ